MDLKILEQKRILLQGQRDIVYHRYRLLQKNPVPSSIASDVHMLYRQVCSLMLDFLFAVHKKTGNRMTPALENEMIKRVYDGRPFDAYKMVSTRFYSNHFVRVFPLLESLLKDLCELKQSILYWKDMTRIQSFFSWRKAS